VFGHDSGVYWFRELDEAWREFRRVMDHYAEAQDAARRAQEVVRQRFTTYHSVGYMVRVLDSLAAKREGASGSPVLNPWIGQMRLSDSRT